MTLTDIPNHKQNNIAKWLFYEMASSRLEYEIFREHNPNYPDRIERFIKL